MIGEPPRTQYDWVFRIFDFPVRVHYFFWIVTAVLGMNTGTPRGVLTWVFAVFLSILVHELGHAFAMRYFGEGARIVLHSFGGLAISESASYSGYRERSPKEQILISLAGPLAGFAFAAVVAVILFATSRYYDFHFLGGVFRIGTGTNVMQFNAAGDPSVLSWLVRDLLIVNILWGILNLLPIYPLDGGQISRELFLARSYNGVEQSLKLSLGTAVVVSAISLWTVDFYVAVMFGFLAFSNYQQLFPNYGGSRW